ncbi:MAG TPA: hypothetical protein VFQ53_15815 [Kofleriaceae bacterium]|nr:hypothetical protein [Kofleriaceae bacterium]
MRRVAISILVLAASCNFAVKHPAITTGLVAGTLGEGTCELASDEHLSCLELSGGIGIGLALIAATAMYFGETNAPDEPVAPPEDTQNLEPTPLEIPKPGTGSATAPDTVPLPVPKPTEPPAGAGSGSAAGSAAPPATGSGSASTPTPAP